MNVTLAQFRDAPWRTSHKLYQQSALAVAPAPEYANSEVIVASLCRAIGFGELREASVPQNGRDLDRRMQRYGSRRGPSSATLDADSFHAMLHSVLESPKLPNQSARRFLQVTPLVPQTSVFSGAARRVGNPWSPGALIRRMICLGSSSKEAASETWRLLFKALSVEEEDDVFARFLQAETITWVPDPDWNLVPLGDEPLLAEEDREAISYPAAQFVCDLIPLIQAKSYMTRRQWTSLLEAILRLGAVAHVLWLCEVQANAWDCFVRALRGEVPKSVEDTRVQLFPSSFRFLSYGDRALPIIKDRISRYLRARLGVNATVWALEEKLGGFYPAAPGALGSAREIHQLLIAIKSQSDVLRNLVGEVIEGIQAQETRAILCRKGIGSNIFEFTRHVLGQRQASNPVLRGYDQGYVLRKKGLYNSSPWIVSLGPVSVLALVHCSLSLTGGPRSVRSLAHHLSSYGIEVDHRDIAQNELGQQLRMLGLVLDSPDAESGMLLVPPFSGYDS